MALKLAKQIDNTGLSVEYWKISKLVFDYIENKGYFTLTPYLNQGARKEGKSNITGMDVRFDIESLEELRDTLYLIAKESQLDEEGNELNPFSTSEDLLI